MNRHEHHVVLITGGAQRLGAAMAHRFAAEGAVVAIGDINEDSAKQLSPTTKPLRSPPTHNKLLRW